MNEPALRNAWSADTAAMIARAAGRDARLWLVAEAAGQIIGATNCNNEDGGYRPTFSSDINLRRERRVHGVGSAMMGML